MNSDGNSNIVNLNFKHFRFVTSDTNSKSSKREFWPDLFAFNVTIEYGCLVYTD